MLNKLCVLELNKSWYPIGLKTPKKVFENFVTGNLFGLHMDWSEDDIKNEDYSNPTDLRPMTWDEWIQLPVRDFDLSITTANMTIRIPNIVICSHFNQIITKPPKLSKKNIMLRDNFTCQFTGIQYDKKELNIDHIIPKSKGGKNTWENLVTCHKSINTKKGDKSMDEAKLKLIRTPYKPNSSSLFFNSRFTDPRWSIFLKGMNNV